MRLIDADALEDKVADLYTEGEEATESDKVVNDVIDLIDNAPTVEYPEQITVECDTEEDKQKLLLALRNVKLKAIVEDERPQGDLISRTWLKEHKFTTQVCNGLEIENVDVVGVATIDNAPTIEDLSEYSDKLWQKAYERGKAERPTEVNCSHCDYFKFSQSFIENIVKFMTDYNIESVEDLMRELNHINELLGGRE